MVLSLESRKQKLKARMECKFTELETMLAENRKNLDEISLNVSRVAQNLASLSCKTAILEFYVDIIVDACKL